MTVKLDKKAGVGQLECKVCGQKFQCGVNCETNEHYLRSAPWVIGLMSLSFSLSQISPPPSMYTANGLMQLVNSLMTTSMSGSC